MTKKNKILIGIISFFIITLIIILCLYSYNNLDEANATLISNNDVIQIDFPFANLPSSIINSNLLGTTNFTGQNLSTSSWISASGVNFFNQTNNNNNNTRVTYSLYDYDGQSRLGFSLKNQSSISPYYNGTRYTVVDIPCSFMTYQNYYTISMLFVGLSYPWSSNNAISVDVFDTQNHSTRVYNSTSDLSQPFTFSNFTGYFTISCPYINVKSIRFYFRTEITGNIYITSGNSPVFVDQTQYLNIHDIENGSFYYGVNTNFDTFGSIQMFNYDYFLYSQLNNMNTYFYNIYDGNGLSVSSGVPSISLNSSNSIILSCGSSTVTFNNNSWSVSGLSSGQHLDLNLVSYYSESYDINARIQEALDSGHQYGYSLGLEDGKSVGYNNGYSVGYNDGLSLAQNGTFLVLLTSVVEAPFNAFLKIFDFNILGYNMKAFLGALISISIALFVIRMILNGSTKNG